MNSTQKIEHFLDIVAEIFLIPYMDSSIPHPTLQRKNAENLKQIFPEKEYRGLSPNFHIHVSVSELYIPTMGLPVLLEEICRPEILHTLESRSVIAFFSRCPVGEGTTEYTKLRFPEQGQCFR
jgi:hypothetical protein